MPELFFTIGPPRSGKSTYCTKWANEAPNRAIVCGDSIRQALGFEFRQETETLIQGIKDTMVRSLLNRGQDVIIDGTHSTPGSIKRIFQIDKNAQHIWIPNYDIYSRAYSEIAQPKKYDFLNFKQKIIDIGINTKGQYIVPVIERIIWQIASLALQGQNLERLRINE